ncbi:glycosyltransferase family 2 protein [Gordonia sp. CPCC 205515]|uniref:glycosyltransferase family 2 protein n=1 Tax=Gordonia sp. CPCC 205515 TaxID=3140791 RepID=UPI003AF3EAB6
MGAGSDESRACPAADRGVSVVIPVYRSRAYIADCLASVIAQELPVHEIILVDDCGGDDSLTIAESVLAQHSIPHRIVRPGSNRGVGGARDAAMPAVTGGLVWFLDSDDLAHPSLTARMTAAMIAADADFVSCGTEFIDEKEKFLGVVDTDPPGSVVSGRQFAQLLIAGRFKAYAGSRIFRRELLGERPFGGRRAYEDMVALAQLSMRANRVAFVGAPMLRYRQVGASVSNSVSPNSLALFDMGRDMQRLIEGIAETDDRRRAARNFVYREVLIPAAHIAMRADHVGGADDPVAAELLSRSRRESSLADLGPLVRDRQWRSAAFAVGMALSPKVYSRILRHR